MTACGKAPCSAYLYGSDRAACHRCGMAWRKPDDHPGCRGSALDIPTIGQVLAQAAYDNPERLALTD